MDRGTAEEKCIYGSWGLNGITLLLPQCRNSIATLEFGEDYGLWRNRNREGKTDYKK